MYQISFYVPEDYLDKVKAALFEAGAGTIGGYSCCAWQIKGRGQFMPLKGSEPFVGQIDQLETIVEYKVEMVCAKELISAAVKALKKAHPYEIPAYQVIAMQAF